MPSPHFQTVLYMCLLVWDEMSVLSHLAFLNFIDFYVLRFRICCQLLFNYFGASPLGFCLVFFDCFFGSLHSQTHAGASCAGSLYLTSFRVFQFVLDLLHLHFGCCVLPFSSFTCFQSGLQFFLPGVFPFKCFFIFVCHTNNLSPTTICTVFFVLICFERFRVFDGVVCTQNRFSLEYVRKIIP